MVRQMRVMFLRERFSTISVTRARTHHALITEAYGAVGIAVDSEDRLDEALSQALACGRTAVVDCRVDPREHCFPMIPAGAAATDVLEYSPEQDAEALAL